MNEILKFNCPKCGSEFEANSDAPGDRWSCSCGETFIWRDCVKQKTATLSPGQIEEIHYRFLTDRDIQRMNEEILAYKRLLIPTFILTKEDEPMSIRYDANNGIGNEIIRALETERDEYIKEHYSEFVRIDDRKEIPGKEMKLNRE